LPKTVLEYLRDADYELLTCIGTKSGDDLGTAAVECGMKDVWLADAPERLSQFNAPSVMNRAKLLEHIRGGASRFYGHLFLRDTHRPWGQAEGLCALAGMPPGDWPEDAYCARKVALEKPDEFAALRRRGLAQADRIVAEIFEALRGRDDIAVVVYSNHGEVFDHFRYNLPYRNEGDHMIRGTSHGPYPYEVLYANMQMWFLPGHTPRVVQGIGRSIDFAPTILQLADIPHPPMDGESMLPHFEAGAFPARDRYAESGPWGALSMVRSDGVKVISTGIVGSGEKNDYYGPDYHQLAVFDLFTDPWEYVNLVDTPRGQEVLAWAIARHRELGTSPPGSPPAQHI
jgi:hypothetical protein